MIKYNYKVDRVNVASAISFDAHKGQIDKAGEEYFHHPRRVAESLSSDDEKIVAYLHDVIEDTDISIEYLKSIGIEDYILEAIEALSRHSNETYNDFIIRVKMNALATKVKIADLYDNMDLRRYKRQLTKEDLSLYNRYIKAYTYLTTK